MFNKVLNLVTSIRGNFVISRAAGTVWVLATLYSLLVAIKLVASGLALAASWLPGPSGQPVSDHIRAVSMEIAVNTAQSMLPVGWLVLVALLISIVGFVARPRKKPVPSLKLAHLETPAEKLMRETAEEKLRVRTTESVMGATQ